MFLPLLTLHSAVRWLILAALALGLFRFIRGWLTKLAWSKRDDRVHALIVGLIDLQLTLGIVLYFLSPLAQGLLADLRASMGVRALRFFGLEHPTMMLLAITVLHVGRARARKNPQHRRAAVNLIAVVILMFAGIPWPFMPAGRPLFRAPFAQDAASRAKASQTAETAAQPPPPVYATRCAVCHGDHGRGDGPAASGLVPRPRDFASQPSKRTKDELAAVIRDGGARHGLSAAMPPNPDLSERDLEELAEYLVQFAEAQPKQGHE